MASGGPASPSGAANTPSVQQFLQQAGVTSEEDVANRLLSMQQQIDVQAQAQQQSNQQLQEALSMLNTLSAQLGEATARAQTAEQERRDALRLAAASIGNVEGFGTGGPLVDSKGVGQPFKYHGGSDQDFSEWSHKVTTYLKAKFGSDVERVLKWSVQQRRSIVECLPGRQTQSADGRQVAYSPLFGEEADDLDRVPNLRQIATGIYTYLIAFTTGDSNKIVRNAGSDAGFEAWRRLHNEYDPTSAMRRVTILGLVQNPPKVEKIEHLGAALEDWLSKKRQYEEFTDKHGQSCKISEDSLMAAMYKLMPSSLEQQVMFYASDYDSFEDLYDRLVSYASTKHSLKMTDRPVATKKADPNAMEVDALSKGKGKKGQPFSGTCHTCGKPGHKAADCKKGAGKSQSIECFVCGQKGHFAKDCRNKKGGKGHGGDKGKGKGGKSKGKESSKGKGKGKKGSLHSFEAENAAEEDWWNSGWAWQSGWGEEQPAQEPPTKGESKNGLGCLDLNALLSVEEVYGINGLEDYTVKWKGEEWLKLNYDSGAATTALPDELVTGDLESKGEFIVASGEEIPNYGRYKVPAQDAKGNQRNFSGYVTKVHKPLGSAAEFSKSHDCIIWAEGGPLARGLRKEYYRLRRLYGDCDELPLFREGNLFNMYLKRSGEIEPLNPVEPAASSSAGQAPPPSSGGPRQAWL